MVTKLFPTLLALYIFSGLTSIAGLSLFGFLIILTAIYFSIKNSSTAFIQPKLQNLNPVTLLVFAYGIWTIISSIINFGTDTPFGKILRGLDWIPLLFSFGYLFHITDLKKADRYLRFIAILTVILGAYGALQMFTQIDLIRSSSEHMAQYDKYFRAVGFFKNPLTYAYCLGIFTTFSISTLFVQNFNKNIFLLKIASFAGAIGLLASNTRGAWISLVAAIMVTSITLNKALTKKIGLTILVVFSILMLNPSFQKRVLNSGDLSISGSNSDRLVVWRANWQMFLDNPVLGVGPKENRNLLPKYYEALGINSTFYNHAHNDYLQVLATIGLPGLIFYLSFSFLFLLMSYQNIKHSNLPILKSLAAGSFMAQLFFHIGSLTQCNFFDSEVNHLIVLIWGLTLAMFKKETSQVGGQTA